MPALVHEAMHPGRGIPACALVLGLLLGASCALPGWAHGRLSVGTAAAIASIVALAVAACFLGAVRLMRRLASGKGRSGPAFPRARLFGVACFALLLASFSFSLLSAYPGFCNSDSNDILAQAMGEFDRVETRYDGLNNNHPVFYILLVRLAFLLFAGAGVEEVVFAFLLAQSFLFALGCAWSLSWMNRNGAGRAHLVAAAVFLAACPVYAIHAITLWKDGLFAVCVLMLSLLAYELANEESPGTGRFVLLGAVLLLTSLLRNNGVFLSIAVVAYLACVRGMGASAPGRDSPGEPDPPGELSPQRPFLVSLGMAGTTFLVAFALIEGPVFAFLEVEPTHFAETVGIPIQQIALVSIEEGLQDGDEAFVSKVFPVEEMPDAYTPAESNGIKFEDDFDNGFLNSHKAEFLSTWLHVVSEHPATALRAWVYVTEGIWKPGSSAPAGTANSVFGQATRDLLGAGWDPRAAFNAAERRIPLLLGKGSTLWLLAWLTALGVAVRPRGRLRAAAFAVPSIVLVATILVATPSGWDYRYILPFALLLPFAPYLLGASMREWAAAEQKARGTGGG